MMRNDFQLFLGEDQIPVIRWVNRFGSPQGRDLRFTVPLEAKSKLDANRDATFTLRRDDSSWEFEVKSLELHTTGTNGVRAIGRVKVPSGLGRRSSTAVKIPKLDGSPSEASDSESKPKKPNLNKLKASKKKKKRSTTAVGAPASEAVVDEPEASDEVSAAAAESSASEATSSSEAKAAPEAEAPSETSSSEEE